MRKAYGGTIWALGFNPLSRIISGDKINPETEFKKMMDKIAEKDRPRAVAIPIEETRLCYDREDDLVVARV